MMKFFVSDTHFGHANVIKLCNRPFKTVEEMDEALIERWNKVVTKCDDVYLLGDFAFRASIPVEYYLDRLKGKKHLIVGNHDSFWTKKVDLSKYFVSVDNMTIVDTGKGKATLCHYPLLEFDSKFMIHGHIHNKGKGLPYWEYLASMPNVLNAGVDINDFEPVLIDRLVLNNQKFKAID